MSSPQIESLIYSTAKTLYNNDLKRNDCRKKLSFLEEQLLNLQPPEGMSEGQMILEISALKDNLNKMLKLLDEHDKQMKAEFDSHNLGVLMDVAESMKSFMPYF